MFGRLQLYLWPNLLTTVRKFPPVCPLSTTGESRMLIVYWAVSISPVSSHCETSQKWFMFRGVEWSYFFGGGIWLEKHFWPKKNFIKIFRKSSEEIVLGEPVLRWAFRCDITFKIMAHHSSTLFKLITSSSFLLFSAKLFNFIMLRTIYF